jgi:type VI secretion system protein ImpG
VIENYYEEELRYLYESGSEFAKAHPQLARYLNIDSLGDRDPYVERLFEGFAFIAGRIREKLDESLPQLTEGLINLVWPQFFQEIPSLAIVQFEPRPGYLQESKTLPAGSEITTGQIGPGLDICRFRTIQPTIINPLSLIKVKRESDNQNNDVFSFVFSLDTSVKWEKYNLKKISIFLYAEYPVAMTLHRIFTTEAKRFEVQYANNGELYCIDPCKAVKAGGFEEDETILPTSKRSYYGHNLLREYFAFPEKFLFIEFRGIDTLPVPRETPETIIIKITVSERFPVRKEFSPSIFRLYCSPVINMFLKNTESVVKDGLKSEYRIVADYTSENVIIHSIHSVIGVNKNTGEKTLYEPYYTFRNIGKRSANTYATRFVYTAGGKRQMNISFGGPNLYGREIKEEIISIEAWCTNGRLPRDMVHEGEINSPGRSFPDYIRIFNITRPTLPVLPPEGDEYVWTFHTSLAATIKGLADREVLRKFLQLYDWSGFKEKNNRIESIAAVKSEPVHKVYKGCLIFGIRFIITIEEKGFKDTEDLHLFGLVLLNLLNQYVQVNNFCELQFLLKPSDKTLTWNLL